MPYKKFVVLTSSRTGSTWLMDLLNNHEGVEGHGELFLGHSRLKPAIAIRSDYQRFVEMHGSPGLMRPARVFVYLNRLYRRASRTIGFKLMYSQLRDFPEILVYLAFHRIRIVHLVRRNHLDVIIAEELAKLTGASHARADQTNDLPRVHLNTSALVDRMRRLERRLAPVRTIVRLSTCPSLEITYESLIEGEQEFSRVLEFLDLPSSPIRPHSRLVKRGTRSHRDAVANYNDVKKAVEGTEFQEYLR